MARANRRDVLTDREIQVVLKGPKQGASHLSSTSFRRIDTLGQGRSTGPAIHHRPRFVVSIPWVKADAGFEGIQGL